MSFRGKIQIANTDIGIDVLLVMHNLMLDFKFEVTWLNTVVNTHKNTPKYGTCQIGKIALPV